MPLEKIFPPFDPGHSDQDDGRRPRRIPFRRIVPNLITILAICAGMTGIRLAFEGRFEMAVAMVLGAALLDGIDGRVARLLKGQSRFGAEMDSLADIVNFGLAPALLLYAFVLQEAGAFGWTAALLYTTGCALRLARFNTMLDDPYRPKWHSAFFVGVPAPAGAALALLPMYVSFVGINVHLPRITAGFTAIYLVFVGLLMASRIPTWSGKGAGIRVPRNYAIPITMLVVLYVATLVSYFWETLTVTILLYYVSIPFSWREFAKRAEREARQYGPSAP
ncbi:phosphatidylcholine/phosphatidylserine synthase [Jiella sp. MQZ9-1]|uniref:Phosphatidylcholine/phosphatidylserine synthase n=1 Tax=Jiella flava TaxID=2816857 RepID=A0A939FY25_9HYPH|nr:phosphatidylcholine/phosphatidylserine synthase [Jiella flava]MBO0661652.1 phosphatidylcholine/phosphatidylserine synthase [Jiella flava]MCD2470294.1 phosphatidylcholine/phosphatidylserine synthase [Jiella flava]